MALVAIIWIFFDIETSWQITPYLFFFKLIIPFGILFYLGNTIEPIEKLEYNREKIQYLVANIIKVTLTVLCLLILIIYWNFRSNYHYSTGLSNVLDHESITYYEASTYKAFKLLWELITNFDSVIDDIFDFIRKLDIPEKIRFFKYLWRDRKAISSFLFEYFKTQDGMQNLSLSLRLGVISSIFINLRHLRGASIDKRKRINQGIYQSIINSIFLGIIGSIIGGLILGFICLLFYFYTESNSVVYILNPVIGIYNGLFIGLIVGGFASIQHFTLRIIFFLKSYSPWNYASFLKKSQDHLFMQRVGGGYIFIHRMLMEHFANMELEK